MPQAAFDCVIRGGRVGTAVDEFDADIGISDGVIVAIGRNLPAGTTEIDAKDRLVLPGGVDAHAHIEQLSAAGIVNADTFESATTSAAFGGTTSVICFAAQHRGMNLMTVVGDYMALAKKGAVIDYTFHMILTDPTEVTLKEHVPALVAQGHSTLKVFMTYDLLNVGRREAARYPARRAPEQGAGVRARREPRHDLVDGQAARREGLHRRPSITPSAIRAAARPRPSRG